mgnify:CR=1 FL=1
MKVLMINVVCGIRSTGRICTDLAVALEQQGHEVKIAYGRESVPRCLKKYAVRIGTELDTKMHGVTARLLDGAGFGSKRVTENFIKWVKLYNPDVIHLHNIHGYYINVEVLFKYLKGCGKKIFGRCMIAGVSQVIARISIMQDANCGKRGVKDVRR